jgi:putative peptide zinc metalloprotease protein
MLPGLRQDLDLIDGGLLPDGQPFWTLHDPARHLFFRIDWPTFEILNRWTLGDADEIAATITRETTLQMESREVIALAQMLADNQLLEKSARALEVERQALALRQKQGFLAKLLHTYLFVRIPLLKPDLLLEKSLPLASIFWSKPFWICTALAFLSGLFLTARQWGTFENSVIDTLTPRGLMSWGVALIVVKFLHELGHAYAAKRHGCRVPTMGIVLLVMWPVPYTDTNEVWRLPNRTERLKVASAGIVTELVIAVWALLAWDLLPDGGLRNAALVLAASSWITTLVVNASPFLRFDGYFILSDLLDFPNLHQRSSALALWHLRQILFGAAEPKPEQTGPVRERFLVLFALVAWAFRLIVFFGIALLVYHFFFKALGVLLFLVEIWWFILAPVIREVKTWKSRFPYWWRDARGLRRAAIWCAVLFLGTALFAFPWSGRVLVSGMLHPAEMARLYSPGGSRVITLNTDEGQSWPAGAELIALEAPAARSQVQKAHALARSLSREAASASLDERRRGEIPALIEEREGAFAELGDAEREVRRYVLDSPHDGRAYLADPDLAIGQWVREKELLVVVARDNKWTVEAYIDEYAVARLKAGSRARFFLEGDPAFLLPLTLIAIDEDASPELPDGRLAAQNGGNVLCRVADGRYIPESAVYRAVFRVDSTDQRLSGHSWRGTVVVDAAGESLSGHYFLRLVSILLRESGV